MDFFSRQDDARRMTRRFVILFVIVVVAVAVTIYLAFAAFMVAGGKSPSMADPDAFMAIVTGTLLFISLGSVYKVVQLSRGGGAAVARSLGGIEVHGNEDDPGIRVFHNVAEEMSIAAGCPVPRLFVLEEEKGINAFAAGLDPTHAAIGVTRGALKHLDRNELQAVVAHEYGHIVNGDMRLNLKMIGVLHGLLMISITGYWLLRVSSRMRVSRSDGRIQMACIVGGLVMAVVGWIGVVGGRIIKSAVSRQREYLADASATQFTRYPEALAGALKKIGSKSLGSWVRSPSAEEMSHLFIGDHTNGRGLKAAMFAWTSTHPPLEDRIRRLDPSWNGEFDVDMSVVEEEEREPISYVNQPMQLDPAQLILTAGVLEQVGGMSVNSGLRESVRDPFGAWSVVLALLLREDSSPVKEAITHLAPMLPEGMAREIQRVWPLVKETGDQERLTLIELALPALQSLEGRGDEILSSCREVIYFDGRQSSYELFVEQVLESGLTLEDAGYPRPGKGNVRQASRILFSHLAVAGHEDLSEAEHSYGVAWQAFSGQWASPRQLDADLEEIDQLKQAFRVLRKAPPGVKKRIIEASAMAVMHDEKITPDERALIGAAAIAMGIPIPQLGDQAA